MNSIMTLGRRAARAALQKILGPFQNPDRSRYVPLSSSFFGPPRRMASTPSYCHSRGYQWIEVYPSRKVVRRDPACVNHSAKEMLDLVHDWGPSAGIAIIPRARIVSEDGWIVGPDDTFLPEHSWFGVAPIECPIYRANYVRQTSYLPGRSLTLASDFAVSNYGHTLLDALSRVHLFEAAGFQWDAIDHVIVPDLHTVGRQTLAGMAGIPADKIVNVTSFRVAKCETLIAPSFPGLRRETPEWVPQFWRKKAHTGVQRRRRIYISRKGQARSVQNEDEIISLLRTFGFETLVPGSGALHRYFQEAAIIVGTHGAALADLAFCSPGSVLIEFTPSRHVYPYFYTLADAAGMRFISILSQSDELEPDPAKASIYVPIDALSQAVEAATMSSDAC